MTHRIFAFLFVVATIFIVPFSTSAQDGDQAQAEVAKEPSKDDVAEAKAKVLQDKMVETMSGLTQEEASHFLVLYTNYNVYSLVKAVQNDIGIAVAACAENNPEIADKVTNRFSEWQTAVGSTLQEADANIKNMSLAQTYLSQAEIQEFFTKIDEVRAYNSSRFETTPVSTPEACEFMMSKMSETEKSMQQLLLVAVASYPDVLRKTQK